MKKSIVLEVRDNQHIVYEDKKAKAEFYIISLWLLYLMVIILTIDIPLDFSVDSEFIGIGELLKRNVVPLISLVFLVYGIILCFKYKYRFKGTMQLPVRIIKISNINYEHLTFLTTYIIPLICIDIKQPRYFLVFVILIVIIGCIYVKTNLFYANPTLALLGYHIYEVETNDANCTNAVFISNDVLKVNEKVQYIQLDQNIYYVGRTKK